MVKAKAKTLKRVKKPSKKTYFHKGGQTSLEFINLYNLFSENLEKKKELFESIKKNGSSIYDSKTTQKNDSFRISANDIILFLEDFNQTVIQQVEEKRSTIQQKLLQYSVKYTQYFVEINMDLDTLLNEINETLTYARNINSKFQSKDVHVHLIQSNFNLLNEVRLKVNDLNERLRTLLNQVDTIYEIVKKEPSEDSISDDVETYKRNIQDSISTVNRLVPDGFIPNSNTKFIKGCPLGTTLNGDQCVYYNGTTILDSVPFQDKLVQSNSDYVVWFNQINEQSVGLPTIFKKKPIEYLLPLSEEDSKLFKLKYVVAEQNGTVKLDRNNMKKFVNEISCCWDQDSGLMGSTGNSSYYIDYDNLPQPIILLEKVAPTIHKDLSFIKYVKLLNEEDQVLSGIQYLETDISGNILYNKEKNVICFYPDLEEYEFSNNSFTKKSFNTIDIYKYILLEGSLNKVPSLNANIQTSYDTALLNSFKYNVIPLAFVNKYVEINVDKYFSSFILPSILVNEGDYFLIHNKSSNYPIIVNISKTTNEANVVLYPNEIYCFIYSNESNMLQYGFIKYSLHDVNYNTTNKVAKIMPLNKYVFVEPKDYYDGETLVMSSFDPIYDSQKHVIAVPNFDESKKSYYNFDDVFQLNPIQVEVLEPQVKVVNNKTFDSGTYNNISETKEFTPYSSNYVSKTNSGVLLFCDESGKPLIDMLGYFIPVITPILYNGTNYFWINYEKESSIEFKRDYIDVLVLDSNYVAENQFTTKYVSKYLTNNIYTNKDSKPIVSNQNTFVVAENISNLTILNINISENTNFSTTILKPEEIQTSINTIHLSNKIENYIENTKLLIHQYKDISGNMNNLEDLLLELQHNSQIGTIKSLDEAETNYKNILKTSDKLKSFLQTQEFTKLNTIRIQEIKQIRKNELQIIQTSINDLSSKLVSLKSSDNDYTYLENTLKKLKNAYDSLNYNMDSINDYDILKSQEQNTKILMNSIQVLQNNIVSFEKSLEEKERIVNESTLKIKENNLLDLQKIIDSTIESINDLKSRRNELNEVNKIKFDSYLVNLNNIIELIEKDKTTIVNTVHTIDSRIKNNELYIQDLNKVKKNLIDLLDVSQIDLIKKIQEGKLSINKKIHIYKKNHENILSLLKSLNISSQEDYESELRKYYTEIIEIESLLANENDLTILESKNSRIDEIQDLENTILTDLQTIELNPTPEPVTLIQVPLESETLLQTGGKKRHSTRKHKRKSNHQ
uniref:Uncharacterized protein n=1 Tax=viral metagenome TaxID=1070528 RepID=A0A6C0D741_9ZZZZ